MSPGTFRPAASSSVTEKTPAAARSTVAADAPVSRFTSTPSPSRFSPYVPLIRRRSTSHPPHGPCPRHASPSETARDAAAQSTEHPSHGAHGGDMALRRAGGDDRLDGVVGVAAILLAAVARLPRGRDVRRGRARVRVPAVHGGGHAAAAPEPEDASACFLTDPGPRTTVVAGSTTIK